MTARAQNGIFPASGGGGSVPLATGSVSTTRGPAVPAQAIGISEPAQSDSIFWPLSTNCGNGTTQPNCVNGAIYEQLLANLTTVSNGRTILFRQGAQYGDPYNYSCLQVPVGLPITNGWSVSSGGVLTLNTNNTITFTGTFDGSTATLTSLVQTSMPEQGIVRPGAQIVSVTGATFTGGSYVASVNTAAAPTTATLSTALSGSAGTVTVTILNTFPAIGAVAADTVYVYSFSSANAISAGINNPQTPTNIVTPYTVTGATGTSLTLSAISGYSAGALSGTDIGRAVLAAWWEPNVPPTGSCSGGGGGSGASLGGTKLYQPISLVTGPISTLITQNANLAATIQLQSAQAQYCNGHRLGPYIDSYSNSVPAPNVCMPKVEVPMWLTAFTGHTSQLIAFEPTNEPDNYGTEGASWNFRGTGYTSFSQAILDVGALTPGSGQTAGTYTINASVGAGQIQVVIPSTGATAGQCVDANITILNAGSSYFPAGGNPSPPTFTMPTTAGTACTLEASVDNYIGNFFDIAAATSSLRGSIGLMAPSEASGATYDYVLYGGSSSTATLPSTPYPTWPNDNDLIANGLSITSRHNYAYGGTPFCPQYPIAGMTRTYSAGTGEIALTTTVATNFATNIPLTTESYSSGSALVTAYVADNESITSHSNSTQQGMSTVVTMNTASAPAVWVGETIQTNGFTTDTKLNGANPPFTVTSVGANSYTVTAPFFSDTSTDTGAGYDQPYIYGGSKVTLAGVTSANGDYNFTGGTIAGVNSKVHPAYFTLTTASVAPSPFLDATGSGGTVNMYGSDNISVGSQQEGAYENITGTGLGTNGTSFDELIQPCSTYSFPCLNSGYSNYPFYSQSATTASHTAGYGQGNTHQIGAIPLTWTSPTTANFTQTGSLGVADTIGAGGQVEIVTGTATNSVISPVYNPSCYPRDLLMHPLTTSRGFLGTNAGTDTETKGINAQFSAYPYNNTVIGTVPFRIGETNSETGANSGIANATQQGIWLADYAMQLMTFNGVSSNTNSNGNTWGSPIANPGFDGFNFFWGNLTSYSPVTATCPLLNKSTDTGSAIQPAYYGLYALNDFLKVNSYFLPVSYSTTIPGLTVYAVQDSQGTPHDHVMIVNRSLGVSGNVSITDTRDTSGGANYYTAITNPANAVLTFNPTITALSGGTATFTFPTTAAGSYTGTSANVMYNMPLYLTGFTGNNWLNGQTIYVLTQSGTTITALVTPGTFAGSGSGTASEYCAMNSNTQNAAMCQWGYGYGDYTNPAHEMTFEGSVTGVAIGTDTPMPLTAISGTFTIPIPPASVTVLDLHP
jgi:hypothetical protein